VSRVSSRSVTFTRPFRLPGMLSDHPAGTFEVWLEEDLLDVSWEAYSGVTTILLGGRGRVESWVVKPDDLEAALIRDRAA
jgi:hypothetical protein